ncbi:hypothetical protein BDV35DRAFT_231023 [Aspergillus flavus]|uniref:Uncharacterized protein n=1 Tax=Aspergillus flavus TaxID=5059 RepID=A0A5N6GUY0_ASPFL|nr:hypothetical protein BDV35DRAFT_231023 [Aspergillus flavus]
MDALPYAISKSLEAKCEPIRHKTGNSKVPSIPTSGSIYDEHGSSPVRRQCTRILQWIIVEECISHILTSHFVSSSS